MSRWRLEHEVLLFSLVCSHKPAGEHRDRNMLHIVAELNRTGDFSEKDVWAKLRQHFNLDKVEEIERGDLQLSSDLSDVGIDDDMPDIAPEKEPERENDEDPPRRRRRRRGADDSDDEQEVRKRTRLALRAEPEKRKKPKEEPKRRPTRRSTRRKN